MAAVTLLSILKRNASTEIGRRWNFASVSTVEEYRKNVPLTTYDDYRPYIDRMVERGEVGLIAEGNPVFYAPTSGTTSRSKLFPRFTGPPKLTFDYKKTMLLLCWHKNATAPSGVPIIPANTAVIGATIDANPSAFAAPPEAYKIRDLLTALYIQLVFGIKDRSVECIWSPFCPTVVTAFNLLKQEWKQIEQDIRNGSLKQSLNIGESERSLLERKLGEPDEERADEIKAIFEECEPKNFQSIAHRLWPNLTVVDALAGGPLQVYIPNLQHYLGSQIHLFSSVYPASEGPGIFGINKWCKQRTSAYLLLTSKVFFEFIPQSDTECSGSECKILTADEVKPGSVYEIVLTTDEGLYRYCIGDLVKVLEIDVSGSPVIDILGRTKMTLSLHCEKLNDVHIGTAISALTSHEGPWKGYSITDFAATADSQCVPPRHIFWIELSSSDASTSSLVTSGITFIDNKLAEANGSYADGRTRRMIGQPTIHLVRPGTFGSITQILKARSPVTETQLKVPHIITTDFELIETLHNNIIKE